MSTRYLSCAETAKLLRTALKASFPGVKFSVRSDTYSGGASIDVKWTDGPTETQVQEVAWLYRGATFDGMIDLKTSHTSLLATGDDVEVVHFGADFIFCDRKHSDGLVMSLSAEAVPLRDRSGYSQCGVCAMNFHDGWLLPELANTARPGCSPEHAARAAARYVPAS